MALAVREAGPEDGEAIERCFTRVFGSPRSLAIWRWKYLQPPLGARAWIAIDDANGEVVAHFGGIRQRLSLAGRDVEAWNAVDVMTSGSARGRGGRASAFVRVARAFFAATDDAAACDFGFPGERHQGAGALVLGYRPCFELVEWRRPIGAVSAAAAAPFEVRRVESFGAEADSVWESIRGAVGAAAARSAAHLNWRYYERPGVYYQGYLLGTPARALAVARHDGEIVRLMDFCVPPGSRGDAAALVEAAAQDHAAAGARAIAAWAPPQHWQGELLAALGFTATPSGVPFAVRPARDPAAAEELARGWASMGDYDVW